MSHFQSAVITSPIIYPNAVAWSEENLVALACGGAVLILNPHNPKVRGAITVPSSERFPIGKIDGGVVDISEMLYTYYKNTGFEECQSVPSEGCNVETEDDGNLGENTWQVVPVSVYEEKPWRK